MLTTFLHHQWLGFWRSRGKGSSIAIQVILGLLVLYLLACAFILGLALESILPKLIIGQDPIIIFNGMILYYFVLDFLMRLQLQELPTLSIAPYLPMKIRKKDLVNFLNLRALFSAFNLIPLFVFFPFCAIRITGDYGPATGAAFMVAIFSLAIFNNYLALYVKRLSTANFKFAIIGVLVLLSLAVMDYFKVFSISAWSDRLFQQIIRQPALAIIFPILAWGIFFQNARYLFKNLYLEELGTVEEVKTATDYPFLNRFGAAGTLVAMEIKLILRNKRPRSTVSKALLFVFYGFLLYRGELLENNQFGVMLIAAIFMTGNMTLLYGQFMFGWQSAEFDGLLANKTDITTFIKAKFLLFTLASSLLTMVVSLYGLISWKILLLQFAAYFYSIGVAPVLVLYVATRNYKYIDLSKGSSFNWQGVGAASMIMSLPVMLLPFVVYIPVSQFTSPYVGLAAVAALGLAGLFTRNFWVAYLVKEFKKRKYKLAEGFRERSS